MFEEMREAGSKLPDMVDFLKSNGWKIYNHHDNWIKNGVDGEYDTHQAYKIAKNKKDASEGVGEKESPEGTYIAGFDPYHKEPTLQNKVFEALGEVSLCWNPRPTGVFDSTNAERIGNELMKEIDSEIEVYRKIAYEVAKSQTGKVLMMDINMVPENMDVKEFLKTWKQQQSIQLVQSKPNLQEAIEVLCNALRKDEELYLGYQSNIAMSFVDAVNRHTTDEGNSRLLTQEQLKHYANDAAENFLNLLIAK